MSKNLPIGGLRRERGAAMIIALVMLAVLTVLGSATARMTLLEERMTGNTQDARVAFQAAEGALRQGEDSLEVAELPEFDGDDGLYQPAAPDDKPVWEDMDFDASGVEFDGMASMTGPLAEASASYIIEQLPRVTVAYQSTKPGVVDEPAFYRVTAQGVGIAGAATVTLQTTYRR